MILGLVCALTSAVVFGIAAVLQAAAVRTMSAPQLGPRAFVRTTFGSWLLLAVVGGYLAGFVLHAVALWLLPLYLAQASISLSLPVTAIISAIALRERLGLGGWLAVCGVIVGLALVAAGAGTVEHAVSASTVVGVGALWLLVVAVGAPLTIKQRAGVLGAWSGLAYAGTAVTTRGLDLADPFVSCLGLVIVSGLGATAFWLYSVALGRAEVASSTASLIVVQTCIPAAIGVVVFGDTVRAGWAVVVLVGIAVSSAGAIYLGRRPGSVTSAVGVKMGV